MATSVVPSEKKKRKKIPDHEILESVDILVHEKAQDFVAKHDFEFFRDKTTLSQASKKFSEGHWLKPKIKISVLNVVLKYAAKEYCDLWRKKLKGNFGMGAATSEQWDKIKIAVDKLIPYLVLNGVNKSLAERIIRTKVSVNQHLMDGLPARMRV